MAWTQTDIDALKRAIRTGARRVEYGSGETRRVVEYRTLAEMERLLGSMNDEVAGANAPPRVAVAEFCRD